MAINYNKGSRQQAAGSRQQAAAIIVTFLQSFIFARKWFCVSPFLKPNPRK
jgi:hypothetical protein